MGQAASRILVVEDDPLVASYLYDLLDEFGYICALASSSCDALWLAATQRPDIAILDIRLNGPTDGVTLARTLRDRFGIPVIFLSGVYDDAIIAQAKLTNPVRFLHKPSRATEIVGALEAASLQSEIQMARAGEEFDLFGR
jgi:two-component system, response regulator PdtaR